MDELKPQQQGQQKPKTEGGLSPEEQAELERLKKVMQESPDPTPEELEQLKKITEELK